MERDERMRLKGELVTAQDELSRCRCERNSKRQALQGVINGLSYRPLTEKSVEEGCELLREAYRLQQEEKYWAAEVERFQKALAEAAT